MFFPEIATKAEFVVGVDVSGKLLMKAKEHKAENVHVVQADADHLPFHDGSSMQLFRLQYCKTCPNPEKPYKK